jgi:multidrug efflux pump subunit AcrA (membrane-fusion protein)
MTKKKNLPLCNDCNDRIGNEPHVFLANIISFRNYLLAREWHNGGGGMRLYVEVGNIVKEGDLLVEIDTAVLEAKVESNKAELVYQKAQLKDRESKLAYER